ncbi:hypothetical protein [Phaeovulum sp. W22_SRMD_FR3]|uniref:hypothetical protein n=1 Tax=Phaeovulum sp. W22_SRMD_FR3 TaxID=3240274 RepID=UPI003F955149
MTRIAFLPVIAALGLSVPLAAPARAEANLGTGGKAVYADCRDGGCRCTLSPMTTDEVSALIGTAPPEGARDWVVVSYADSYFWSAQSLEDIDSAMGGDGRCDLEVFAPVVPRDGTWTGKVRTTKIAGCPEGLAQTLPGMVSGMVFARRIAWGGVFHPAQLNMNPSDQVVNWTEIGPTMFQGKLVAPVQNDMLSVSGTLTSSLVDEDSAVARFHLRVGAGSGANAAALAMLGMADCRVDSTYQFKRSGA